VLGAYSHAHPLGDQFDVHVAASVGNGEMCVVERGGGDIEPGDYLISSDVFGCAMKDDPARFPVGHIVARAAERVQWSAVTTDNQGVRTAKVSVLFGNFVRTESCVSEKVFEEYARAKEKEIAELRARMAEFELLIGRYAAARTEATR
jgi:hypothetical protein